MDAGLSMKWSSIRSIETSESLEAAYALRQQSGQSAYFAGGTYLVAQMDPAIHTLIDINPLVESGLKVDKAALHLGAGMVLEEVVAMSDQPKAAVLSQAARWSCPSRNIRNQRTLGGELGRRRTDSELVVLLLALNARLHIASGSASTVALTDWDGDGIITSVTLLLEDLARTAVERFALLPSAPAFVIVAGLRKGDGLEAAVGGKADEPVLFSVASEAMSAEGLEAAATEAAKGFPSDHYGSQAYKKALILAGLKRIRSTLWP